MSAASALAARDVVATITVVGLELGLLAAVCGASFIFVTWTARRLATFQRGSSAGVIDAQRRKVRQVVIALAAVVAVAILGYNGWLIARRIDVASHTLGLIGAGGPDLWTRLGIAAAKLAVPAAGLLVGARIGRRIFRAAEAAVGKRDQIRDNDHLDTLFRGLGRAVVIAGWLFLALYALRLFGLPQWLGAGLLIVIRMYVVIAMGLAVIRSSVVIVDTLDGLSRRYAERRGVLGHYDHLRPLIPTFRACLEYALWVGLASVALLQFHSIAALATWGPKLIEAIGIFFLGRVAIELGHFEIGRRLLPPASLDEMEHRRRSTMAPLVRSTFSYAVWFGTVVLILASLGFNPMPFLAGAGILGLVVGFGAQSLINDVVSGFFILFENTYLVGDMIEVGKGRGVVEAIEFRTTKIRDTDGRVHIIRNGDVKDVINFSRDYTLAVVPVDIAYEADLRAVFSILREAGERVRAENPDAMAAMQIDGITAFGAAAMTVRTSMRVRPGRHEAAAAAMRYSIKEAFDRRASGPERRGLVPAEFAGANPAADGRQPAAGGRIR